MKKLSKAQKEQREKAVAAFVREHATADTNMARLLLSAIKDGLPSVYESMKPKKSYGLCELYEILFEAVPV